MERTLIKIQEKLLKYNYELLENYEGMKNTYTKGGVWKKYKLKHIPCGTEFMDDIFNLPRCPKCFKKVGRSQLEVNWYQFIKEKVESLEVQKNVKGLLENKRLELDIYIPEKNIAFEVNGAYYHSKHSTKNAHKEKTEMAEKAGIKLYHIWEFVPDEIIESKINLILGTKDITKIYARKLKLCNIPRDEEIAFFKRSHVHGYTNSRECWGLRDKDTEELYMAGSLRTFGKKEDLTGELARVASLPNIVVTGGFSRILKKLKKVSDELGYKKLISFADRDWSPIANKTVYENYGFKFMGDSGPTLFYTDGITRYSRERFQKHKLKKLFPDIWDENLTANFMLSMKGIYPAYNSGNWKFEYDKL